MKLGRVLLVLFLTAGCASSPSLNNQSAPSSSAVTISSSSRLGTLSRLDTAGPSPSTALSQAIAPSEPILNPVTTLSVPGSATTGPDVLATLVSALSPSELTQVALGSVPSKQLAVVQAVANDQWISFRSNANTDISQARAQWQAALVTAAMYRLHGATIKGGSLAEMAALDSSGPTTAMSFPISPLIIPTMYTNGNNEPSSLVVGQTSVNRSIEVAAKNVGLTISDIHYSSLLGTIVEVRAVTPDPTDLVRTYGRRMPLVTFDPGTLEGILVTIVDADGNEVMVYSYATGLRIGQAGVGAKYAALASSNPFGAPAAAPTSSASQPVAESSPTLTSTG